MSREESGEKKKPATPVRILVLAVLLGFVAVSVGYLVYTQVRPRGNTGSPGAGAPAGTRTVVYYFYTNVRCASCRRIEQWTREALEKTFPAELSDGRIEWKPVNVEEKGNEHFVKDFALKAKTVVVSRMVNGKTAEWADMIEVWELLADQKRFSRLITDKVRQYIEKT